MPIPVHRNTDSRTCGAKTIVEGQDDVFANNLLVSVDNDPNTHGGGELIAINNNVYVNNKLVVNHTPEQANPDGLCPDVGGEHCNPKTAEGSPNVFIGDDIDTPIVVNLAMTENDDSDVDQPGSGAPYIQKQIENGRIPAEEVHTQIPVGDQDQTPPAPPPPLTKDCSDIASITPFPTGDAIDAIVLTPSNTVGKITRAPSVTFDHPLRSETAGLSVEEIVCNLKLLTINCIEPIKAKYPNAFVTNSYRPVTGNKISQHSKGQAADIQFRSTAKSEYFEIAKWIRDNITYDQLLLEYKTSGSGLPWIHISFNKAGSRKQVLTLLNNSTYSQGLTQLG